MQINLPMLTYYTGPRLISQDVMAAVLTYREAVRVCWDLRTRRNMTRRQLGEESGAYASHITDYLHPDEGRRELPAKYIADYEVACGNRAISQYLASRAHLTILEQFIETRRAA